MKPQESVHFEKSPIVISLMCSLCSDGSNVWVYENCFPYTLERRLLMPAVSSHRSITDVTVHFVKAPAALPFNPSCLYLWSCFTMTLITSTSEYNFEAENCVRASRRDGSRLSLMSSAVFWPKYFRCLYRWEAEIPIFSKVKAFQVHCRTTQ